MQNTAWVALLRHIPAEQHNQFMLVVSGTEISVQSFLRIEQEFVALKGRLAGSQDAGRVFFVPYANIDYIGTNQLVKDSDFNDTFGSLIMPGATCPVVVPTSASDQGVPSRPDSGPRPTIRSEVLDRYRSRPSSASILPNPKANGT